MWRKREVDKESLVELVRAALWIAAIDTVPVENRVEKVEEWANNAEYHNLYRLVLVK